MPSKVYLLALIYFCLACSSSFAADGLFGSMEFKLDSIKSLPKWQDVLERIEIEKKAFKACDENIKNCKSASLSLWRDFVKESKSKPRKLQLQEVNHFINRWPYIEDSSNWLDSDYWASPIEFLDKSGDCEDFAIIKYVTLKELGVKEENMRIAVVMDKLRLIYHAVLVVYDDNNRPYILDSLFDAVLPHNEVLQYTPHYSVNAKARWAHVMPLKKVNKK